MNFCLPHWTMGSGCFVVQKTGRSQLIVAESNHSTVLWMSDVYMHLCAFSGHKKIFDVFIFSQEYQKGKKCTNTPTVFGSRFLWQDAMRKSSRLMHQCFQQRPARRLPSVGAQVLDKAMWKKWQASRETEAQKNDLAWAPRVYSVSSTMVHFSKDTSRRLLVFPRIGDPSMKT